MIPLRNLVIIKPAPATKVTGSGLVVVQKEPDAPDRGLVLDVGPGVHDPKGEKIPMTVSPGDLVIYNKGSGTQVTDIDGSKVLIIPETEILGILQRVKPSTAED